MRTCIGSRYVVWIGIYPEIYPVYYPSLDVIRIARCPGYMSIYPGLISPADASDSETASLSAFVDCIDNDPVGLLVSLNHVLDFWMCILSYNVAPRVWLAAQWAEIVCSNRATIYGILHK